MMGRKSSWETPKLSVIQILYGLDLQGPQGDGVKYCNGYEMEGKRSGAGNIQPIYPQP